MPSSSPSISTTNNNSSNDNHSSSSRSKVIDYHGGAHNFPQWKYSVRLQAMSKGSTDILDDIDNPFKRDQRTTGEEIDAPSAEFGEGEKLYRPKETHRG